MKNFRNYLKDTANKKDLTIDRTTTQIQYPTGFMYLDYINGSLSTFYDEHERPIGQYHNIGIMQGSVNSLISKSQGGKTTMAIKMACGNIEPWLNDLVLKTYINPYNKSFKNETYPLIQIADTEKTMGIDYVKKLTKYKNSILSNVVDIAPISTDEELIFLLDKHVKYKIDNMKKIYMPMKDIFGEYVYQYPPTVLIVDSITQLVLKDTEGLGEEEYTKQTQGTAGAKRARIISNIYSQLVNYAKKYNIIIYAINHINQAPNMSFLPSPKQYRGLKVGETLSGGERAIYLASNILRLDVIKNIGGASSSSLNYGEDVKGFVAAAKYIKSKTNSLNNGCNLVYIDKNGYDPLWSTVYEGIAREDISKSGNFYYLDEHPDKKFNMKSLVKVFKDNTNMIRSLYEQTRQNASILLDTPENAIANHNKETKQLLNIKDEVDRFNLDEKAINEFDSIYNNIAGNN